MQEKTLTERLPQQEIISMQQKTPTERLINKRLSSSNQRPQQKDSSRGDDH